MVRIIYFSSGPNADTAGNGSFPAAVSPFAGQQQQPRFGFLPPSYLPRPATAAASVPGSRGSYAIRCSEMLPLSGYHLHDEEENGKTIPSSLWNHMEKYPENDPKKTPSSCPLCCAVITDDNLPL